MTDQDKADRTKAQIARINELSAMARASWLALLAYLTFIGIALLPVKDADFFIDSRQTKLPLVDISIPTASFFVFAPVIAAALYVYLHIHLLKLWDALRAPPDFVDGKPMGDQLHAWLVNDFALARINPNALAPRSLRGLSDLASRVLVWIAGPFVIAAFWWRSMPAHNEWLTLGIGICLLVSLRAGFTSWWDVHLTRGRPWQTPWAGAWKRPVAWLVTIFVIATSWLRTEGGFDYTLNRLVNLADTTFETNLFKTCPEQPTELAEGTIDPCFYANGEPRTPDDTQELRIARHVLTLDDLTFDTQDYLVLRWIDDDDETWSILARTDLENVEMADLPADWRTPETARKAFRETWCKREGLDMKTCDHVAEVDRPAPPHVAVAREEWCEYSRVSAGQDCTALFTGFDGRFEQAWREERDSALANLPKPALAGRDLRRANGTGLALAGANLSEARLEGADLAGARLEGAYLREARLEGAVLWRARLEGADLSEARLDGAVVVEARLEGADLSWARLEGANLRGARLEGAVLVEARLDGADLSWARLEGADLRGARLDGANLRRARLEGAVLWRARLEGADLQYTDFRKSNWVGASNRASLAQFADFRAGQDLTQAQLENLIGNRETLLPDTPAPDTGKPFYIWSCWADPPDGLDALVERVAQATFEDTETIRADFLCPEGQAPQRTGTPCAVDLTREQCLGSAQNPLARR